VEAYLQVAAQARRDELIVSHLPLVRHVLGRLLIQLPVGVDVENLEAAGVLGLVEAANRFEPDRGIPFGAYATRRVRGAILDELRRNCPLPQRLLEQVARVRRAYGELPAGCSVEELAVSAGLTADEVADCLAAMRLASGAVDGGLLEGHPARAEDQPDLQAERAEQRELLTQGIEALPEQERLVLTLYYREDLRLKEIGEVLQLSESRVCRVLNAALFHLGEHIRVREGTE
jgi:RNA polymerase sigma factor for flagellar operon FliA